jgi:hypothetical protein
MVAHQTPNTLPGHPCAAEGTELPKAIHEEDLRVVLAYPHALALPNGDHPWRALARWARKALSRRQT